MSDKLLLKPAEAIQELGISYSTLLRKVKSGEIPSIKIGSQLRIPQQFCKQLVEKAFQSSTEVKA